MRKTNLNLLMAMLAGVMLPTPNWLAAQVLGTAGLTLSPVGYANGRFELRLNGPPNRVYRVDASADLVNWSVLSANVTGGALVVVDPAAGAFRHRFYRASASPEMHGVGQDVLALQGLQGNTLVAGKTTAFRFFTDPLTYASANRIEATILRPDGSRLVKSWPRSEFVAVANSTRGRSLVVRVAGRELPWVGGYYVQAKIFDAGGGLLANYSLDQTELLPTKDLRVMVDRIWSGTATKPGEIAGAHEAMQRLAAVYPVRDGISTLDGDRSAGLRYLVNDNPSGPPNQDGHICPLFASWLNRPLAVDSIDVGLTYRFPNPGEPPEGCGANANHVCPGQNLGWSVIVWQAPLNQVFSHECGHNLGLVPPQDPHWDGGVHSKDLTIDSLETDLGFDIQFNRPFPNPTYDIMYPTGPCPGWPAENISFSSWDWEFLRQRIANLPSTGPAGPSISWQYLSGQELQPDIAVGKNADGRQEVFVLGGDRRLWHQWETSLGGGWSGWATLEGVDLQGPIAVANNADGRLEVYVRGGDGYIYYRSQAVPNGGWNGWAPLGGGRVKDFSLTRNADGRLELVAVWNDGTLRDVWQTSPNGSWSSWANLGGVSLQGPVALGQNADGRLEAFVVGGDGVVYHQWQTSPGGSWSSWANLAYPGLPTVADVTVNRTADGRLFLLLMRSDNSLSYRAQTVPNGGWDAPVNLYGHDLLWPAVVTKNPDGRLEVFVIGGDHRLYNRWQVDSARPNVWSQWQSLGGQDLQPGVAVGSHSSAEPQVFVIGGDGALWRGLR